MSDDSDRLIRERKLALLREKAWRRAMDPADPDAFRVFCEGFVKVTTWTPGEFVPLVWNPMQERLAADRTGYDIVLKARQMGSTTFELARDLWFALVHKRVTVAVVVQPHKDHEPTKKNVRVLGLMVEHLGRDVGAKWTGNTLRLGNGSVISIFDAGGTEATAEKQGRGGTYHRLHFTEAAFYPYADAVVDALRKACPPPDQGGETVVESTPNGAAGLFYRLWRGSERGETSLRPLFYPWFVMPRYTVGADEGPAEPRSDEEKAVVAAARSQGFELRENQLAHWRRSVVDATLSRTMQEYPSDPTTCFLESGDCYFDRPALTRLQSLCIPPVAVETMAEAAEALPRESPARRYQTSAARLYARHSESGGLKLWTPPLPGRGYLIVADCAGGALSKSSQRDYLCALLFDWKTRAHVGTMRTRSVKPSEFARRLDTLGRAFGDALICVERNPGGHGGTVIHVLEEETRYPRLWRDGAGTAGFYTGPANRTPIIDDLGDAIAGAEFVTVDGELVAECLDFVRTKEGRIEARPGCHDDMVMGAAIGWRVMVGPRTAAGVRDGTATPDMVPPAGPVNHAALLRARLERSLSWG